MRLTDFMKEMLGFKAKVEKELASLPKPSVETPPSPPLSEGKKHDDDDDDDEGEGEGDAKGKKKSDAGEACPKCEGSGECSECEGSGECSSCEGTGKKMESKKGKKSESPVLPSSNDERLSKMEARIKELETNLAKSQTDVLEAQQMAQKTLASFGINVTNLPVTKPAAGKTHNYLAEWQALQKSDPRAAGAFYMEHAEEIIAEMNR